MKKLIIFLSLVLLSISACAMGYRQVLSPSVFFVNLSSGHIKDVQCNWAGIQLVSPGELYPGITATQSTAINNIKDFYGTVHLTWQNSSGKKFEKTFEFTENDLPVDYIIEANKPRKERDPNKRFATVMFEFTQDGVDMYTSATPGANERAMRSGKLQQQLKKAHYN